MLLLPRTNIQVSAHPEQARSRITRQMTEGLPLLALDLRPGFSKRNPGVAAFAFAKHARSCSRHIGGGPFAPEPLPLLRKKTAPSQDLHTEALKCVGTDADQYSENSNPCDACSRVL